MKNKIKEIFLYANWKNILFSLLGSAILAFGTNYIYVNSDIPEGGMIGLCLIIEHFTGIHPSISNIVITLFCYALAWRLMGTRYILNTSVATIGFSVFYALFSSEALDGLVPSMAQYPLLAALVGAFFVEVGTAITHRYGSAPSGEQALTMAISKRGAINYGWIQFFRDFTVLSLFLFTYEDPTKGIYPVLYAILIMTLLTPVSDYIVNAPKHAKFAKRINRTKGSWIPVVAVGLILATILTAATIYLTEVYSPTEEMMAEYFAEESEYNITIDDENDMIIYAPEEEIKAGFVFYPGGKVDPRAYSPLMVACANNGILCVVVEMPFNLAVFGINKAADVLERFPDVNTWYIGGHSLGGSMAASFASTHTDIFKGIIFLASYSTIDLSSLNVLSVRGTEDLVMDYGRYQKYKENLPTVASGKFFETTITGGNHSYFGTYGEQKGDGAAKISNEEQISQTVKAITEFINKTQKD